MKHNEDPNIRKEAFSSLTPHDLFKITSGSGLEYICELPHVGPLLVSAKKNDTTTLVMIRSVLGWLTYSYIGIIVGSDSMTLSILLSLYRYFPDVIDGWNVSFRSKKSTFYDFFNIFGFGSFNKIKSDALLDSSNMGLDSYTKTKVLCDIDRFLLPKFMNRFAMLTCFDVEEIEKFTFSDVVSVSMTQSDFATLFPDLPTRHTKYYTDQNRSITSFPVTSEEMNKLRNDTKPSSKTTESAIKEFLITEAEYFNLIDDILHSDINKLKSQREISESTYNEFFGNFMKIYKAEMTFIEDLFIKIRIVRHNEMKNDIIEKIFNKSFNDCNLLQNDEQHNHSESTLLKLFVDTLLKNSENWKNYISFCLSYESIYKKISSLKIKNTNIKTEIILNAFEHCLQRLLRYPHVIEEVLKCCIEDSESYTELSKFYLQLNKFLHYLNKLKEQEENYLILHKIDSNLQICVAAENQQFIDQLDCQDEQGKDYTIFLLSNQVILTRRRGKPASIKTSTAEYIKIQVFRIDEIEFYKRGQTGFYLIGNKPIKDARFTEIYKNCSLSARYFISNDDILRNRFIRNFYNTISFFSYKKLLFVSNGGDYESKIIKEDQADVKDLVVYQITSNRLIQTNTKDMSSVFSHVFSHSGKKTVFFHNDDVIIKAGRLVFHVIDYKEPEDVFSNLYFILNVINRHYLRIEEKICLYQYFRSQSDKPFSTGNAIIDLTPLINFSNEVDLYKSTQIYCDSSFLDYSFQRLSQIIEPQVLLRSKFIMQEIVEINSDKKLTGFKDANNFTSLCDYEPKLLEDLISKILDNEDYMSQFRKIFKSKDDVHRTITNYLSQNVYCYFTNDDLQMIELFIKQGEHLDAIPVISNKSLYNLLIKYFQMIAQQDRAYLVSIFFTRIFSGSSLTEEEISRVTHQLSSLD